jgi:NAD(P)H-nitrite reductase large subunit
MSGNRHVVIIGNGISGVTCARHLRKLDEKVRITLVSGESKYFFSRTALMYIYMGHMKFENSRKNGLKELIIPPNIWFSNQGIIWLMMSWSSR